MEENIKMKKKNDKFDILENLNKAIEVWQPPGIQDLESIPKGDMPGDQIKIEEEHIKKANLLMPELLKAIKMSIKNGPHSKLVISVHGGSGVGKSETGALLSFYLKELGIGSYVLSGDNYPRRIPVDNDRERLRIYRTSGLKGLLDSGIYNEETKSSLEKLWENETDGDIRLIDDYKWLNVYQHAGCKGLEAYLGSPSEIDFDELNKIIYDFKHDHDNIYLKRMGRGINDLWYDQIDFGNTEILLVEWTHGNNKNLVGVDIPILLNSTPAETLAHRKSRNRDGKTDTAFTKIVLEIEQGLLKEMAHNAKFIVSKQCELLSYKAYLATFEHSKFSNGPMLNAYPDSVGQNLSHMIELLSQDMLQDVFDAYYILPSVFNSDLDRGFSVIDYDLNCELATKKDLNDIRGKGMVLKLDFVLNHASVLSKQFQDLIKNGQGSKYSDFFINWNEFWQDCGPVEDGVVIPDQAYMDNMFFRKPGLPILKVRMPDGSEVPYWNTFYQEIKYDLLDTQKIMKQFNLQYLQALKITKTYNLGMENEIKPKDIKCDISEELKSKVVDLLECNRRYLGQMDLNIKSDLVWEFYHETLKKLADYGTQIVRLDAFAYGPKAPGERNFLNDPETWGLLSKVDELAKPYDLELLPEIHAAYEDGIHRKIADKGYMIYDFFLPGLLIDGIENQNCRPLKQWIREIIDSDYKTVNMLGCHDGIPLLDLKGLLEEHQIKNLIDIVVSRGGYVKDLHGKKNIYYQVNATYFSALGEDGKKMLMSRAVQMFMPGKPQIWYLDIFAGKNDHAAVKQAGPGGHKEINRTNLSLEEAKRLLDESLVQEQVKLIKFRNNHKAFGVGAKVDLCVSEDHLLKIVWQKENHKATLRADFKNNTYEISKT